MTPPGPPSPSLSGSPADSLLRLPESYLYKSDRRSRVWRVETEVGQWVVKRFEYSPLRQRLALILGLHPAQRERRQALRLAQAGIPVVPIAAHGAAARGLGAKAWLITPFRGVSLLHRLRDGDLTDRRRRLAVAQRLAALVGAMFRLGAVNRDLKTSNILLDDEDRPWLIDVGAVRFSNPSAAIRVNLAVLGRAAAADGVTRLDRLRFLRLLATADPALGDWRALSPLARPIQASK